MGRFAGETACATTRINSLRSMVGQAFIRSLTVAALIGLTPAANASILSRDTLDVIDHDHFDPTFARLQFQSELILNGGED